MGGPFGRVETSDPGTPPKAATRFRWATLVSQYPPMTSRAHAHGSCCADRPIQQRRGMAATYDLMGAMTAFASDTPDEAERILTGSIGDMARDIRDNWAESRSMRAQSFVIGADPRTLRV